MPIDPLTSAAFGAVVKWLNVQVGRPGDDNQLNRYKATQGLVMVVFVNEHGDPLQEAWLTAVPRVGEDVELAILPGPAIMPQIDATKLSVNQNTFERLKTAVKLLILGHDPKLDTEIGKQIQGVELPDPKFVGGTVLRVKWAPFVASPELAITTATVVIKLQD
ncbi:MAG TPA: hypothetical protein VG122_05750 [Gemmata sp.]|jgi:hypothetical protein|nr:hypothetical protein [Gemmata sp.]